MRGAVPEAGPAGALTACAQAADIGVGDGFPDQPPRLGCAGLHQRARDADVGALRVGVAFVDAGRGGRSLLRVCCGWQRQNACDQQTRDQTGHLKISG